MKYFSAKRWYQLLFSAHSSVDNEFDRRVTELLAIFIFVSSPVAPIIWYFQEYFQLPEEAELTFFWGLSIFFSSVFCYILVRSRWYIISIYLQIVVSFIFPYYTAVLHPQGTANYQALVFPVCLAALLMNLRQLIGVACLVSAGFISLFWINPVENYTKILSSFIIFLLLAFMLILIRYLHSSVERIRLRRLSEQNKKYTNLINTTFDGTALIHDRILQEVSQGFADVFQVSTMEMKGQSIHKYLPQLPWPVESIVEYSFQKEDGQVRFVQMVNQYVEKKESIIAIRDITQERVEQAARLQMDRMTSTGMLAAGIAHELNTPLMIAMNHSNMAINASQNGRPNEVQERLQTTQDVLGKMGEILKDLKWFVQPSKEEFTASPKEVIDNAIRLANHRIRHLSKIHFDCLDDCSVAIAENQLNQLIINLLFNAAEARRSSDSIVNIRLSTKREGAIYSIRVEDDGIGISQEMQRKIFEPFFTTSKTNGTGLGLAICQGLLSQVGGNISVESSVGNGATFIVQIPISPKEEAVVEKVHRPVDIQTVLLIDDDVYLLELLSEMLHSYQCYTASNIVEGQRLLEEYSPDIIVCDIVMSTGGGRELYRALVNQDNEMYKRIIFITGGTVDTSMQVFLEEHNQPVIYKPFRLQDINQAFTQLHRG